MLSFIAWIIKWPGARDRREADGAQGVVGLEGAEGNGDNIGIYRRARHEA
jgi:hypothetical protein